MDYQSLCNKLYNFAEKLERQPLDTNVLSPPEACGREQTQHSKARRTVQRYIIQTKPNQAERNPKQSHKSHAISVSLLRCVRELQTQICLLPVYWRAQGKGSVGALRPRR